MRKIRYLDKLIDELARGKKMEKILRKQILFKKGYKLMILADKPYISEFMKESILKLKLPVLKSESIEKSIFLEGTEIVNGELALEKLKLKKDIKIYSNSENSINWIINNLNFTELPKNIDLFKDKVKFRKLIENIYPNFFYKEIDINELKEISIEKIKMPFIIKPSVGFFSMGVYMISNHDDWLKAIKSIEKEIKEVEGLYPKEVLNTSKFIIEEYIEGEEFAFDAYYNSDGEPVILNILKHIFSDEKDVSDRVYITSKEIINENIEKFFNFLEKLGNIVNLKNFPLHVEVRVDKNGEIMPIEVNPMRFAGWCTTDIAYFAYNINTYEYYFKDKKPNWKEILKGKENKIYSIIVLDNSTNICVRDIKNFDYNKLCLKFNKILELRKIDYNEYPLFGFLFTETEKENYKELEWILKSDLTEFVNKNKY
ncbi:MAG: hypothetical protein PWP46_1649 [Fusobacteriaceae bacterium]|jgi:hypothetical protein|nr:ATP-grasp protein [Fusobacteriales bacterium]MDN5304763.1 hypothetical protein [Fusobacteriaceae bacterium]